MILFGFPCVGKTSIGKCVARKLARPFIDTDRAMEETFYQMTARSLNCHALAHEYGLPFFRELEKKVITSLPSSPQLVIALGGGAILSEEIYSNLKQMRPLIYLKAPFSLLAERNLARLPLPSYIEPANPKNSLKQLFDRRCPQYEKLAQITIDIADLTVEAAADLIVQLLA